MTAARLPTVLKLAGSLAVVAVAVFAVGRIWDVRSTGDVDLLVWLLAGAVLHDAVLLPAYTTADTALRVAIADGPWRRVRAINHIRVPAVIALVVLLAYAPSILGDDAGRNFERVSGRPRATDPLEAWLWITLGLFAVSGLVLALRLLRARRAGP
ncbi:hypothetical protein [Conexibacter sp. SYSU D00693]|uniref:hypothetical protein n=1 Tax=Conexibacter sp. SYSU D00693 TaxID=2812560 RepID=UPI00196A46AD|nr:hypothetical protein [Conexibacter sp. SYSU D00693]